MYAQPRRRQQILTDDQIEDGFRKLTSREWRFREAQAFARRLKKAPAVAAPFLADRIVEGPSRERAMAAALLSQIEGPRAVAPMWDIFRDQTAPREARYAAAAALESMGEEPGARAHARDVREHQAFLEDAWEAVFERAQREESFVEQFLATLEEDDEESAQAVILSLAEPRDERALLLLTPLLYVKRTSLALTAIDAIELLGGGLSNLEEAAEGHPTPKARKRARAAYGRLVMQAPLFPDERPLLPAPVELHRGLPLHFAGVSLVDQRGDQAVVVARRLNDEYLKVVTVLVSDTQGVKSCVGVDQMRPAELDEINDGLAGHGLPVVVSELDFCLDLIEQARATSLRKRRRLPPELEIWRRVLEGPPGETPYAQLGLWDTPSEDDENDLAKTSGLLATPEFRQWYLDPEMVWPFIDEWQAGTMADQSGPQGQHTLDTLVELAARDLIDCDFRDLLRRRLSRQADLLLKDGKGELAYLSSVAARSMDREHGVPVQHHPFVRALVMSSFFNAGLRLPGAYAAAEAGQAPS